LRHRKAEGEPSRDPLRVLLINGTSSDAALVAAAVGPQAEVITAAGADGSPDEAAARRGEPLDVVLVGRELALQVDALVHRLKSDDPYRPVILLSDDPASVAPAVRHHVDDCAATNAPHDLGVAIAASLARASRARAADVYELRQTEAALRRSERRARLLISLADAARRLDRPAEIAQSTVRLLRETLAADRCA
jgi:hypothetical protein